VQISEGLSQKLIDFIKTGIILTDRRGTILFTNRLAVKMLEYEDISLIGQNMESLFLPDDMEIFYPNILNLTLKENGFEGEVLLRKGSGATIFVHISTSLYSDNELGHDLLIFALQDISLLKKMEKECQRPERAMGLEIITDQISHQIRNPIVSIGGFALRLAKAQVSPKEYARYIEIIHNEAKRLEYLIDRLVELAKVHHGRFSSATPSNIFERLKDLLERQNKEDMSKIVFPDVKTLPVESFYCDPELISLAISCVVKNSLEAMKDNGKVLLTCKIEGDRIIIKIKDDGCGIGAESLPFIFDPFFTTKFNSLGLGLTMARRIVNEHKGSIDVYSIPDKGTEVTIALPKERRREVRRRLFVEDRDKK